MGTFLRTSQRIALCICIGQASLSYAEDGCTGASPKDRDEYKALGNKAKEKYDVGLYSEAIGLYRQAYALCHAPTVLYNIAQSYRLSEPALIIPEEKRGALQQAIIYYDRAMAAMQGDADPRVPEILAKALRFRNQSQELVDKLSTDRASVLTKPPVYKKAWFWTTIIGSVSAAGLAIGLGTYYGTRLKDPASDLGTFPAY